MFGVAAIIKTSTDEGDITLTIPTNIKLTVINTLDSDLNLDL